MKGTVLITGASGFLGKEIVKFLSSDYSIVSLGRSSENDISIDLSQTIPDLPVLDHVIHAAGKAHSLPTTEEAKDLFYAVNVKGTKNLLKGLEQRNHNPKSFLFISSVAVYGLKKGINITEQAPLRAVAPYGQGKKLAEKEISEWCSKRGITSGILRLPLVVGANPPGNLAKMILAVRNSKWLHISGGKARRSMVMADDIMNILERIMGQGGIYNLTDGQHPSYHELYQVIARQFNRGKAINLPYPVAWIMAKVGDLIGVRSPFNSNLLEKLTSDLIFSDEKAKRELGWDPTPVLVGFSTILRQMTDD